MKKQDSQLWGMIYVKLPQIVDIIGDLGVKIGAQEVLSFAQAAIGVEGINIEHVKSVLINLLP